MANFKATKHTLDCLRDVHAVLSLVPLVFKYLNHDAYLICTLDRYEVGFLIFDESNCLCQGENWVNSIQGLAAVRRLLYASELFYLTKGHIWNHIVILTLLSTCIEVGNVLSSRGHCLVL